MRDSSTVVITGAGAICAAGRDPDTIWHTVRAGRSSLAPVRRWDTSRWPCRLAGDLGDLDPRELVENRKLHKLLQRGDLLGLYAAGRAIAQAHLLDLPAATESRDQFNERTAVYVGSGGAAYQGQHDFFPLLTAASDDLGQFGHELTATVNPMWLLRTLPNNVLCHIGIQYGFKGPNGCITNHSVSGVLAIAEAAAALRDGEAERAVAVAHHTPVEPEYLLYLHRLGVLASDTVRPFDRDRDGSVLGEGAAAVVLETVAAAAARGTPVLGTYLGSGGVTEGEGILSVRADGDGLARAIAAALDDAGLDAGDVGLIVAHGNGTRASDCSEAAAIHRVFGTQPPPVTAFKWAFGHTLAAAGMLEAVVALWALRHGEVPGIPTLRDPDPTCHLPVSSASQTPRSDVALVLSRGFAGTNAALLLRGGA